jgi:hypothetical protein
MSKINKRKIMKRIKSRMKIKSKIQRQGRQPTFVLKD